MHIIQRVRISLAMLAIIAMMAGTGVRAQAQGGGLPPDVMQKIKAWTKWLDQHKKVIQLADLIAQVGDMDKDSRTQLDKAQSAKMLKIIKTWCARPAMNDDDAVMVEKQIGAMMTEKQLKKIATIEPPSSKMRKASANAPKPKPGEQIKIPDPPAKGFNPFNPDTLPTMFDSVKPAMRKIMSDWSASLEKRAKG